MILVFCTLHAFLNESRSGPCSVPSLSTLVIRNSEYPSLTKLSKPWINSIPVFSFQPPMTIFPFFCSLDRIRAINCFIFWVPLNQPHHIATHNVDCRNHFHLLHSRKKFFIIIEPTLPDFSG